MFILDREELSEIDQRTSKTDQTLEGEGIMNLVSPVMSPTFFLISLERRLSHSHSPPEFTLVPYGADEVNCRCFISTTQTSFIFILSFAL